MQRTWGAAIISMNVGAYLLVRLLLTHIPSISLVDGGRFDTGNTEAQEYDQLRESLMRFRVKGSGVIHIWNFPLSLPTRNLGFEEKN